MFGSGCSFIPLDESNITYGFAIEKLQHGINIISNQAIRYCIKVIDNDILHYMMG